MKKAVNIAIAIVFSIQLHAQSKIKLDVESQGGYEYNYFKSPDQVRIEGVLLNESDLISSSIFQTVDIDFESKLEWDNSKLRLIVKPSTTLFYENVDDSYWSLIGQAKYYNDINRNVTLLADAGLKRMNRTGLDGAQDVLINPLGYTNFGASLGVQLEMIDNNKTTAEVFYSFRDFDAYGIRDLQYNEIGISFKTKQDVTILKTKAEIGVKTYSKIRKYDTFNATNLIANGKRDWSYVKVNPYIEVEIAKDLTIEPSIVYYQRFDKIERSGFTQFGPELAIDYDLKKTRIKGNISYLTRNYKSIDARDNTGLTNDNLTYKYTEFNLAVSHKVLNNLEITADIYSRIRTTNYLDLDARSFRGYRNQYAGIGAKWEL